MLDTRVESLEQDVRDRRLTLRRSAILPVDIRANLPNRATRDAIRTLTTATAETADLRARMATRVGLDDVRKNTGNIRDDVAKLDGRVSRIPTLRGQIGLSSGRLFGSATLFFALERALHP